MVEKFKLTKEVEESNCLNCGNGIYYFKNIYIAPHNQPFPEVLSAFLDNHPELEAVSFARTSAVGWCVAFKTKTTKV